MTGFACFNDWNWHLARVLHSSAQVRDCCVASRRDQGSLNSYYIVAIVLERTLVAVTVK
jgi:hypothetical protein